MRFFTIKNFIRIVVLVSVVWLPTAAWYTARGMQRQHHINHALAVFRDPDASDQEIQRQIRILDDLDAPQIVLLFLIQELNQQEHRYADMRLCRGLSRLLTRRQEHAAADAASRLLDGAFMWPHVRFIPDLVIELRKPVIEEPSRRRKVNDLIKRLRGLCLKREVDYSGSQRALLQKGARLCLADSRLDPEARAQVQALLAALAKAPADQPVPQTFASWRGARRVVQKLRSLPDADRDALDLLQSRVARNGPRSSFLVGGSDQKILSTTLKHLQRREAKWEHRRGLTASTLRFEPTSMEQLDRYVAQINRDGVLEKWERGLIDAFRRAAPGKKLQADSNALRAWSEWEKRRSGQIESLCRAIERLLAGKAKLADVTRQAVLFCVAGWKPRNGLEGASQDTPLERFQDFLWGEREWLPDDLREPPSIVEELRRAALRRVKREAALRRLVQNGRPLSAAAVKLLRSRAEAWEEIGRLPVQLKAVIEGDVAGLRGMTCAQREFLSLKCLWLQSRYRRGRRQVALAAERFVKKVVDGARGKFARRTEGEEVGDLRAIGLIWKQRDEQIIIGDLVRLLSNEFDEVRAPLRRALVYIGRPAIPPLETLVLQREINQIMAVETSELSKEEHTKLLERQLRTGRAEAGLCLAAIGERLMQECRAAQADPDEDADVLRVRRALHQALNDPRSGLDELWESRPEFRRGVLALGLSFSPQKTQEGE